MAKNLALLDLDVLVKLVQAGTGGVAIACMLLSFWLLWTINRQALTSGNLPVLQEKNRAARSYMYFSVGCLAISLASIYFNKPIPPSGPATQVRMMWNPDERPKWMQLGDLVPKAYVYKEGKKIYLQKGQKLGHSDDGNIVLDYQAIIDHLYELPRLQAATMISNEAGASER